MEALSIKPTPTLLWGRTTCYAVGLCIYLCQCQARALTIIDYVCLPYQPKQGIGAFRSPETITLCLSNEWVVPVGQNKAFFECFGSNVLVLCGLLHRANVHVCHYDIWRSDGVQAFSKNLRQLTGHATRTVGSECLVVK